LNLGGENGGVRWPAAMVNSTYSKGNNEEGEAPWKMKGGGRIAALTKEGRRGGVSVKIRRGAAALMSPVWMKGHRECGV
jgi:hypothetical protein